MMASRDAGNYSKRRLAADDLSLRLNVVVRVLFLVTVTTATFG